MDVHQPTDADPLNLDLITFIITLLLHTFEKACVVQS